MRHIFYFLLIGAFLISCRSDQGLDTNPKVDIYKLKSFTIQPDQTTSPATLLLKDAVLSDTILVADKDIISYTQSSATFSLKNNIAPIIKDYTGNQGFAITVNKNPIYFGIFHPAYLSSMVIGIPTIDPIFYDIKKELTMNYILITGNTYLSQIDKRNDSQIIDALKQSGRLR